MNDYSQQYLDSFQRAIAAAVCTDAEGTPHSMAWALKQLCMVSTDQSARGLSQVFVGNGASMTIAAHMALDWSKNGGILSESLGAPATLTAVANDIAYENVFAEQLKWRAKTAGVLVAISSSGNSPNILAAARQAQALGMGVLTFSGLKPDNALRRMGDVNLYVPAKTYGIVECAHQLLLHMWLDAYMGLSEWTRADCQDMRVATP